MWGGRRDKSKGMCEIGGHTHRIAVARVSVDIFDHGRAGAGAVAHPQLPTICASECAEEELAVEDGHTVPDIFKSLVPLVELSRAGGGAVTHPQLIFSPA